MATSFVLVPGAWLGKWAWERVTPILEQNGDSVFAVTLPGLADRSNELSPSTGLLSHVKDVLDQCDKLNLQNAVLVGHSYAGAVVGAVARRSPKRFRAQVYLDTMPLAEGSSFLDGFSPEGRAKFEHSIVIKNGTRVWPMPEPLSSQAPTEGLSESDLALLREKGTPHPARTFEEKLAGHIETGTQPKSFAISCVEDDDAGKSEKEEFLSSRPDWEYFWIPSISHWPMLSSPKKVASILLEIGEANS
jgi:pimeloyl-ACP methyl ester carboxylesterase